MIIRISQLNILKAIDDWPTQDHSQSVLKFLQSKGAPVSGYIVFKTKPGYLWKRNDDPITRETVFEITEENN